MVTKGALKISDFSFDVGSDQEHEDLVADLYYKGEFICMVSQENGFDSLDIEISGTWTLKLDEFIMALNQVKKRLWELRKTST